MYFRYNVLFNFEDNIQTSNGVNHIAKYTIVVV